MKKILPVPYLTAVCILSSLLFISSGKDKEKAEGPEEEVTVEETEAVIPLTPAAEEEPAAETEAPEGGTIRGKVADETGNPVPGVDVYCIDNNGATVAHTLTDEKGNYVFEDLKEGEYSINIKYSGLTNPIEIKFEDNGTRPAAPSGLIVYETYRYIHGGSFIRAKWDSMPDILAYKCELYLKGSDTPLVLYPDMKQNFCEFGNLKENTAYRVLVYSKNKNGYSITPVAGEIQTINKAPLPPFGPGVTYAKNHRVDLIWNRSGDDDLKGYIIQIKREGKRYLYYSKGGLTKNRTEAFVVKDTSSGFVSYSIRDILQDDVPLIDNVTPYSFRIFSIDKKGDLGEPSMAVEGVVLEDTVPPGPPFNIKYEFIGKDRLKIRWESADRDIEKYTLYYGVNRDRWDGVVSTNNTSYELIIDRDQLKDKELFITIKAIDRAGNESGYKPYTKKTLVSGSGEVTENIVLSSSSIYRDYSVAIRETAGIKTIPDKKKKTAKPVYPKKYGYSVLRKKGFVVKKGETALLSGKITLPVNALIRVMSGGTLIVEDARLKAADGVWGGIQYLGGSSGRVRHTVISGAAVGVAVINNDKGIILSNIEVVESKGKGIYIKNSRVDLNVLTIMYNTIGLHIENSKVVISNSIIESNEKGILANKYSFTIVNSRLNNNRVYGLRLYGGGRIKKSYVRHNLAGIVLEEGSGDIILSDSYIELNSMDGIIVNASHFVEITGNLISNNGRHGIYIKGGSNPGISENDIVNNREYAVFGGGKVVRCYIAYNNGSAYIDDTREKGRPDNILSSSSSGLIKQIFNVDYINELAFNSVLR